MPFYTLHPGNLACYHWDEVGQWGQAKPYTKTLKYLIPNSWRLAGQAVMLCCLGRGPGAQTLLASLDTGVPGLSSMFHLGAQGLLTGSLRL